MLLKFRMWCEDRKKGTAPGQLSIWDAQGEPTQAAQQRLDYAQFSYRNVDGDLVGKIAYKRQLKVGKSLPNANVCFVSPGGVHLFCRIENNVISVLGEHYAWLYMRGFLQQLKNTYGFLTIDSVIANKARNAVGENREDESAGVQDAIYHNWYYASAPWLNHSGFFRLNVRKNKVIGWLDEIVNHLAKSYIDNLPRDEYDFVKSANVSYVDIGIALAQEIENTPSFRCDIQCLNGKIKERIRILTLLNTGELYNSDVLQMGGIDQKEMLVSFFRNVINSPGDKPPSENYLKWEIAEIVNELGGYRADISKQPGSATDVTISKKQDVTRPGMPFVMAQTDTRFAKMRFSFDSSDRKERQTLICETFFLMFSGGMGQGAVSVGGNEQGHARKQCKTFLRSYLPKHQAHPILKYFSLQWGNKEMYRGIFEEEEKT